ncbi:MAG TPA: type II secretion system F family protein [Bryobacteraceae bacterium]|nr:type II secretion system F family protein [Bryobacteraceae bacterium]
MLILAAIWVFVAVAGGTAFLLLHFSGRVRPLDRLEPPGPVVSAFLPSPALVWKDLVNWAGSLVPAAPKSLPLLKRRLLRAGYRTPQAVRFFYGARVCTTTLLGSAGVLLGLRTYATPEHFAEFVVAGLLTGFVAPSQYLEWALARRKHAIERALPNVLDLMVVCVESGLGLDQTIIQVAQELRAAHPELCSEFAMMNLEMRAGKRRVEALHNLADRTGVEDVRRLVAVLVQTDRFGTSIAQSLRGHADYLRVMARQRAEERAAKLAVKLVFPIFFCVLPSLFVVTIGPVITRLVRDLFPMIEKM